MIDQNSLQKFTNALVERKLEHLTLINLSGGQIQSAGKTYKAQNVLEGNGVFTLEENYISAEYRGKKGSYQLKLLVPEGVLANGITVKYRILNWEEIRYLAIGHTEKGGFRHVKIANPSEGEWVTFSIGYHDIAYGLQNSWQKPNPEQISDIRLYLSGTPSNEGARIEFMLGSTWLEDPEPSTDWMSTVINNGLNDAIKKYFVRCNRFIKQQVDSFFKTGQCPLTGEAKLLWPVYQSKPDAMDESGTYRYLWHAMQPAIAMMVHAKNTDTIAPIFAARDFINCWLEDSYFKPDPDIKYTWYDHGTAERLLALLFMHDIGIEEQFDYRFMTRLKWAIFKHAQLLESEVFYAAHQPSRYHNHAWFQDMALIAVAVGMPDIPCANRWLDRGIERLTDQLAQLIVRDNGYAIFVENSIGYHHGIQRLVEFAGELIRLSGQESDILKIAKELNAWTDFLRYPDGRSPSQGDTNRCPNPGADKIVIGKPYKPNATILPKAGYAVAKGNHQNIPFMLCVFATSLSKTHKHEDNLSFTLFFDGIEWLIDPSNYSHEYTAPIPAYLRSARGHNNVAIPEVPYSLEPGKAELSGNTTDVQFEFFGEHTAYSAHKIKRSLKGSLNRLAIEGQDIVESVKGAQLKPAYLIFQCGEGVEVVANNDGVILLHNASSYQLQISCDALKHQVYRGMDENVYFKGVAGEGFMQTNDVSCIVFELGEDSVCKWNIGVASE